MSYYIKKRFRYKIINVKIGNCYIEVSDLNIHKFKKDDWKQIFIKCKYYYYIYNNNNYYYIYNNNYYYIYNNNNYYIICLNNYIYVCVILKFY